jgi:hypothetical protein
MQFVGNKLLNIFPIDDQPSPILPQLLRKARQQFCLQSQKCQQNNFYSNLPIESSCTHLCAEIVHTLDIVFLVWAPKKKERI